MTQDRAVLVLGDMLAAAQYFEFDNEQIEALDQARTALADEGYSPRSGITVYSAVRHGGKFIRRKRDYVCSTWVKGEFQVEQGALG